MTSGLKAEDSAKDFTRWQITLQKNLAGMAGPGGISHGAFRFAFVLSTYLRRSTRTAYPSIERVAATIGVSRETAARYQRELRNAGAIEAERDGKRGAFTYRFNSTVIEAHADATLQRIEAAGEVMRERQRTLYAKRIEGRSVIEPRAPIRDARGKFTRESCVRPAG